MIFIKKKKKGDETKDSQSCLQDVGVSRTQSFEMKIAQETGIGAKANGENTSRENQLAIL